MFCTNKTEQPKKCVDLYSVENVGSLQQLYRTNRTVGVAAGFVNFTGQRGLLRLQQDLRIVQDKQDSLVYSRICEFYGTNRTAGVTAGFANFTGQTRQLGLQQDL